MADLFAFPQRRNVGKARHVAALWLGKHSQRDRDVYWKMICDRYRRSMGAAGFDAETITRQLTDFCDAVNEQIVLINERTRHHARNDDPLGAA